MQYSRKTSHAKFDCTYHIIWITKYRYPVMVGDIALKIRELVRRFCEENHVEIIRGTSARDHVHIYVSVPPYISQTVRQLINSSCLRRQASRNSLTLAKYFFWIPASAGMTVLLGQSIRRSRANHQE